MLKKKKIYIYNPLLSQNITQSLKTSHSCNNFKRRRTTLSCSNRQSSLLSEATSTHNDGFYCFHCFHLYKRENKLELHQEVCGNKDFYRVIMSCKGTKILKFTKNYKSIEPPVLTYPSVKYVI